METAAPDLDLSAQVKSAVAGSADALEFVVRTIEPFIARLALRFFGCPEYAKDATQEALTRIALNVHSFEEQCAFKTWAYRVAVNKFSSMARSPAEREARSFEAFEEDLAAGEATFRADADGERALLVAEVRIGCTLAMLLCLDRDGRLAYILGEIVELDHAVAADILECSPAAYRKRLERARAAITALMKKRCGVFEAANGCQCDARLEIAKERGYLNPSKLVFATAAEVVRRFPEVLQQIRRIDEVQRAAAIYRSHPDPAARGGFVDGVRGLLDAEPGPLDQG